jgi:hypothetical protein
MFYSKDEKEQFVGFSAGKVVAINNFKAANK